MNPRKRASTHIDYLLSPGGILACWARLNQRSSGWPTPVLATSTSVYRACHINPLFLDDFLAEMMIDKGVSIMVQ